MSASEKLWNAAEAAERQRDAQVAREVEAGVPVELEDEQAIALVREFLQQEFVARGWWPI